MTCLGSVLYDPSSLATKATSALLAMTALDTTNARITFTAPASGIVLVRIRVPYKGATSSPQTLLGVLEGATVKGRQAPLGPIGRGVAGSPSLVQHEAVFLVTGLSAGSHSFDAAYGVEFAVASTTYGWGGPNNTTASDAYGALSFEVWDTPQLLGGKFYDPTTAASASTASLLALTAIDTTNLRINFTVPASGRVLVRLRCMGNGATTMPVVHLGVLEGATVKGRQAAYMGIVDTGSTLATDHFICQSEFVVAGLTPAANLNWDAAYAVETIVALTQLRWGGPNNTTQDDAYGGFAFEVWAA